jgi:gliding motility-associated-like protein
LLRTKNIILVLLLLIGGIRTVIAQQKPAADFIANKTTGCAPLSVSFTDKSTNDPTLWQWNLGNGQLPSSRNPTTTYSVPGVYDVELVVQNEAGTSKAVKKGYITVYPSANVNFNADKNMACSPATIKFTDLTTSQGAITSWLWNFGDGSTSTSRNPTHQYTNVGYYNISLTVTTSNGCTVTSSRQRFIRIINGITPNFDFSRSGVCEAPVDVLFDNQTAGPGTLTHNWTFGNGSSSTVKNPSTTYTALSTYNVTLTTVSSFGCSGTITKPITFPTYNTSFTAPDASCPNNPISFINNGTPAPTAASWDFGDGTSSTEINPVKAYVVPGTYTITLNNQYAECIGNFTKTITINPAPVIGFTATNQIGCQVPQTVNFQDTATGSSNWLWDFGDGATSTEKNPQHIYTTLGNYTVTLTKTTAEGCPATVTKTEFVQITPPGTITVNGLPGKGCFPFTIKPTASISTNDAVSYEWDFGVPGATSTSPNPSYEYFNAGTYTVTVKITTAGGCVQTLTLPDAVKLGSKPTVDFTASTNNTCAGNSVTFTSTSTPADEWLWHFGDGSSFSGEHPEHKYIDTGYMAVTLIAYNNGCSDTLTKPNLLYVLAPISIYDAVYNCTNPLSVKFIDRSITDPSHGTTVYKWEFGDGQTSNAKEPTHIFPGPGKYAVNLTLTDNQCTYSQIREVNIIDIEPDFTKDKAQYCRGEIFTLEVEPSIDLSNISSYTWQVNNEPAVTGGPIFQSSLNVNGNHDVKLTIMDNHGCITELTKNDFITIVGSTNDFEVVNNGGCAKSEIELIDKSTPSGSITKWTFSFGDGKSQTYFAPPFNHIWDTVGIYNIKLTTTDNLGCIDTTTKTAIADITKPQVRFEAKDTLYCPRIGLQFNNTSIGKDLTYLWDFGDGKTSTDKNPVHSYDPPDSVYTVKLIATDRFGCIDSVVRTAYVRIVGPKPAFSFRDSTTICPPLETKFVAEAKDYESLYWDFGDGNTSTLASTSNFYNTYGSYTAKLFVRGYGGCLDSATAQVNIYNPITSLVFNYGPLVECNQLDVTFNIVPPPGTRFKINFGDGKMDSTGAATIVHTYNRPNFYTPSVILYDSLDCIVTVGGKNRILVKGVYPLFDMSKDKFCDTGLVRITDFSIGNDRITSRNWTFGDGTTSVDENPQKFYNVPGTYIVTQNVTTETGCQNSYSDTVRVYRTPEPLIVGPDEVCINNSIEFNARTVFPDSLTNWRWTYGNGQTSTLPNIVELYKVAGQSTIQLAASNQLGCSSDTAKTVNVWPLPTIQHDPEIVIPVGAGMNLPITYSNNISTYTWTPDKSLSCANCAIPFANPQFTTTYKIAVVDSNGCKAVSSIVVRVICVDKNYFIPNTFSPNNDGQNDVFFPRGSGVDRIQSMRIFNRWGEIVFEKKNFPANSQADGWNGMIRGTPAASDAYIYIIEVICDNGQIIPIKGNVALIR